MNNIFSFFLSILMLVTPITEVVDFPQTNNSEWKPYEDYRCISNVTTPNYQLLHGGNVQHHGDGLISIGEYYTVALGQNFGEIGDKFVVTFEDGHKTKIIMCDAKANEHTIDGWQGHNGHIVEVIVDTDYLTPDVRQMGTVGVNEVFKGKIVKIEREL